MVNIIVELSKYSIILLITMYTFLCLVSLDIKIRIKKQLLKTTECVDVYDPYHSIFSNVSGNRRHKDACLLSCTSSTSWSHYFAVYPIFIRKYQDWSLIICVCSCALV